MPEAPSRFPPCGGCFVILFDQPASYLAPTGIKAAKRKTEKKEKGKKNIFKESSAHPLLLPFVSFLEAARAPSSQRKLGLQADGGRGRSIRYRTSGRPRSRRGHTPRGRRNRGTGLRGSAARAGPGRRASPAGVHLPASRPPSDSPPPPAPADLALAAAQQLRHRRRPRLQDWRSARESQKEERFLKQPREGFSFFHV